MPDTLPPALATKYQTLLNRLQQAVQTYPKVVLASSLGIEDVILMETVVQQKLAIDMFTLETGRLPEETLTLLQQLQERYQHRIKVYFPEKEDIEPYVNQHGVNGFYRSVALRQRCCHIRKVAPLQRALSGYAAWITGLRSQQSIERSGLVLKLRDEQHQMDKINPLIDWQEQEVWKLARAMQVPYNPLHDQHYPSIGCAPCSRAIARGEDFRSGRWWWEQKSARECGLHVRPIRIKQDGW